jgi:hypothetical protein
MWPEVNILGLASLVGNTPMPYAANGLVCVRCPTGGGIIGGWD